MLVKRTWLYCTSVVNHLFFFIAVSPVCCFLSHCSLLGVRRFFLVIVRTSVGFGAEQSGGRRRWLFTLHPPADEPETAGLFEVKTENTFTGEFSLH